MIIWLVLFLNDLASLHHVLKVAEINRGVGVDYGIGVCPVSRRIILRAISTLCFHEMKIAKEGTSVGRDILYQLALAPLDDMRMQKNVALSAEKLFRICECSYDLSFFSPKLVTELLNNHHSEFELLFECVVTGYSRLSFTSGIDDICYQVRPNRCLAFFESSIHFTLSNFSVCIVSGVE